MLDLPADRLAAENDAAAHAAYGTILRRLFALDGYATSRSAGFEPRSD